jgi:hypothetical protein
LQLVSSLRIPVRRALGLGQPDWAANGIPMTRVSADEWTATVQAAADATLSYKYDLSGTWANVEKNATTPTSATGA